MKRLCVSPRIREKKREGRRELFKQKTRRPKQGPGAIPGACSARRPSRSPAGQVFRRGSATEAERASAWLTLPAAGEELETKPGSKAFQGGSNQRPPGARSPAGEARPPAGCDQGGEPRPGPGPAFQPPWLALASHVPPVALSQLLSGARGFKTHSLIN